MIDVESLFKEIKRRNPHKEINLSWINPSSPVITTSASKLDLPDECHVDEKTGNIIVTEHDATQCIFVDYKTKTSRRFGLFHRRRLA